jgi:glutamate/tyrosine decarboxylase-like PLP-dependent enzyme
LPDRPVPFQAGADAIRARLGESLPEDPADGACPVWAALGSVGRSGVAALVDRREGNARALAAGISQIDGTEVLNDVVYTQVCGSFGADSRTEAVFRELIAEGAVWMSGSRWRDRAVLRISVSNWSTDDQDVATSLDAVRRAVAAVDHK